MKYVRRIRTALLALLVAAPAAAFLPGAAPALALSCPGIASLGTPTIALGSTTHGGPGTSITITGSGFPVGETFNSGTTVYFPGTNGSQTVGVAPNWVSSDGTSLMVPAPSNGYSGTLGVCINGNNNGAVTTQKFSYVPSVSGVPAAAAEGSTVTLTGSFLPGQPATVSLSCGSYGGTANSLTNLTFTMPGYCPGQVAVSQTAYDQTPLNGAASSQSIAIAPVASAPSPASTYPGQHVTVGGSGFGPNTGSVSIGGVPGQVLNWADNQITFSAPDGSEGGAVVVNAPGGQAAAGGLQILPHISGVSPTRAKDGDPVTISGQDFGSSPGQVTMAGQPLDLTGWGMDQVTATVPNGAAPGALALTTSDNRAAVDNGQYSLALAPSISSVSPGSASPGGYVYVSGSTFDSQQGSGGVTVGGKAAQVMLWSDTTIAFLVPSGASSGRLVVTSGYGQAVTWGQNFTVLGGGSSSSGGGYTGPIIIKPNYGFEPLPKAPTPIGFHISAPSDNVKPGASVPLTVILQLNGKPVAGAPVSLSVAESPGSDTKLSELSGVTDQNGTFKVVLQTSKKPGQTVVLARSGAFGDEIRIVTLSAATGFAGLGRSLVTNQTLDPHILIPFIGALVLAVLLLLGAVVLQWRLHRRALAVPAPAPAAAVATEAAAAAAAPQPRAPRRPRAPKPAKVEAEPAQAGEPAALAKAVGAEDLTGSDAIAPVIPLRQPEARITRTRARAKTDRS